MAFSRRVQQQTVVGAGAVKVQPTLRAGHADVDRADDENTKSEVSVEHPLPEAQRSRWLPKDAARLVHDYPLAQKCFESSPHFTGRVPPEALFCWTESDFSMYVQSEGFVAPKVKLQYYMSPECPQTIVDLVSPALSRNNWVCTVNARTPQSPPIFIWEGSRRTIDPGPTLDRGGLVNRVTPLLPITTKVGMMRAIQKHCAKEGHAYPPLWYPHAFQLPDDLDEWKRHVEDHPDKLWIYKPNGGARGMGIMLISCVADVDSPDRPFDSRCRKPGPFNPEEPPLAQRYFAPSGIIQEYVQDLLLLEGRKFAVRVYVLVARVRPLLVLLHDSAYVKVCGLEYDRHSFSQAELFRHVTNQEFQKTGGQVYDDWKVIPVMTLSEADARLRQSDDRKSKLEPPEADEAWSANFWLQVRRICVEIVDCFREQVESEARPGSFEILGLDFICTEDGRVTFLEANRDPSWVVDGETKRDIIPAMVAEMLDIVFRANGDYPTEKSRGGFQVLVDDESAFVAA